MRAFVDAGSRSVRPFQTNGTVIFHANDPEDTAHRARELLAPSYEDAVFVRSAARVVEIVSGFPALDASSDHYREMVVFHDSPASRSAAISDGVEGLVRVLRVESDVAFGLIWKPKSTAGNITALLERRLGALGTSRTLGTLQRLSRQFASEPTD